MADTYAGVMGATVATEDGLVVLDLSTPERPRHTRLRLDRAAAQDLAFALLDHADELDPR